MEKQAKKSRLGLVGGQAVLEGVMMKSGNDMSLAVRGEDGKIVTTEEKFTSLRQKYKFFRIPVIRGCVNFVEMMMLSMNTLTKSMEMLGIDDEEPETKFDKWLSEKMGDNMMKIISGIGMVLGVVLGVGLFLVLPTLAVKGLDLLTGGIITVGVLRSLIEGLVRMGIFVGYIALTGLMPEIRRTYEYHGAEHKSIACFESGMPLTPANAKKCTRFHPRCGTSFIFVMLMLSIIVNSFLSWDSMVIRLASKLLTIPLIVGLGFEYIMYAGKHCNVFTKIFSAPGLWMQRITTREPDEAQLAVAITAILAAIPADFREEVKAELAEAGEQLEESAPWVPASGKKDEEKDETEAGDDK
ncbi:MAG: DUF1385 domain-containing protein [Ruminococcaceae bacterium]|nr:DUF1385 domain-containing protein [Oscillospiraceae bacterium]